jgi:ABC-type dipeptide/oligopeptide/nickel transport system permease component
VTRTILRRLLHAVLVLWAAASLVWLFMFVIPGDPARLLAGPRADARTLEAVRAEWGLDQPPLRRYVTYLGRLARAELGSSYFQRRPVAAILGEALVRTAFLAVAAMTLAVGAGVLLGVAAAWRGGLVDALVTAGTLAGIAVPSFWLGLFLMIIFASTLQWFPVSGYGEGPTLLGIRIPGISHLVLPAITLAAFPAALIGRVTRSALLEQMRTEYVLAARARGLPSASVVWRHAFRNSLSPVVTLGGLLLATLLGGAVATEIVFSWPGIGRVIFSALRQRDLPVVEGGVILLTAIFIAANLAVDLAYAFIDPRIRTLER